MAGRRPVYSLPKQLIFSFGSNRGLSAREPCLGDAIAAVEGNPSGSLVARLAKARDAYLASGREEEWLDCLEEHIAFHQRKHKLRPMLEGLAR